MEQPISDFYIIYTKVVLTTWLIIGLVFAYFNTRGERNFLMYVYSAVMGFLMSAIVTVVMIGIVGAIKYIIGA